MINPKDYIPETYYKESRDYQVFLELVKLILSVDDTKTRYLLDVINAKKCPNELLQLLADYVGYDYDYLENYDVNRKIIQYFNKLLRNRGSYTGIMLAVALANVCSKDTTNLGLNAYSSVDMDTIEIDEEEHKIINIYVHNTDYLSKMFYLLDRVRPAGMLSRVLPSETLSTVSKLQTHTYAMADTPTFDSSRYKRDSKIGRSNIVHFDGEDIKYNENDKEQ